MRKAQYNAGCFPWIVVSFDECIFSYAEGIYVKFRHTAVFRHRIYVRAGN
jgi:hypothetical protein